MDYYDELNIDRNASEIEVQKSYRRLTRLVHPDLHPEPELKALAEKQMLRLQQIAEILGHPVRRREYDESLMGDAAPRRHPVSIATTVPWIILGFILGVTAYYLSLAGGRRQSLAVTASSAVQAFERSGEVRPKSDTRPRRTAKSVSRPEIATPPAYVIPLDEPPASTGEPPLLLPPALAAAPLPVRPETAGCADCGVSLSGSWLYASSKEPRESSLYPPEYIEMRVAEHNGWVSGAYRARYRVADRPVAPGIAFDFRGKAAHGEVAFPWSGAGGLKGEVTLKPLTRTSVEVSWHVTEFGGQNVLGAGTAVLIRRAD